MSEFQPHKRTTAPSTIGGSRPRAPTVALRWVLTASVLTAGATHLYLWANGYRELPTIGSLFLLNFAASILTPAMVATTSRVLGYVFALAFGASTILAFLMSVTIGISGFKEVLLGPAQETAGGAELIVVFLGAWLVARSLRATRTQRRQADSPPGEQPLRRAS